MIKRRFNERIGFVKVNELNVDVLQPLARCIWEETYKTIITDLQIDYMLDKMYSLETINEEIALGYVWELVVFEEQFIGYLDYVLQADRRVFLSKIYLNTVVQNRGFGGQLLERVIDYAIANNATSVYLTVNKNNEKALAFYVKNRFKQIGEERFDIGAGYIMDDYIMQLDLKEKTRIRDGKY